LASQNQKSEQGAAARGKPPISRHPLFPAIVALWFGALFGLGSLAIRPSLIESAVVASRIDTLISAAAPPLGMTARIMLALALAIGGAILGVVIARRIASANKEVHQRKRSNFSSDDSVTVRARDAHPDAPARRPFSAAASFGADFDSDDSGEVPSTGRRRALTMGEDYTPLDFRETAPLPGGVPPVLDLAKIDLEPSSSESHWMDTAVSTAFHGDTVEGEPLDLVPAFEAPSPYEPEYVLSEQFDSGIEMGTSEPIADDTFSTNFSADYVEPAIEDEAESDNVTAVPMAFAPPAAAQPAVAEQPIFDSAAERLIAAPIDSLGSVELVERLALALQRKRSGAAAAAAIQDQPLALKAFAPATFAPVTIPEPYAAASFPAPHIAMEPAPLESALEASLTEDTLAGEPLVEEPMASLPMAMRPVDFSFDEDQDDSDAPTSFLPPRLFAKPIAEVDAGVEVAEPVYTEDFIEEVSEDISGSPVDDVIEAEDAVEDSYSSLLDISPPPAAPRQQFIRVEQIEAETDAIEPVVVFPGQAASGIRRFDAPGSATLGAMPAASTLPAQTGQDSEETERALRAALSSLQRMSGAA
jgi:hypothetical protein